MLLNFKSIVVHEEKGGMFNRYLVPTRALGEDIQSIDQVLIYISSYIPLGPEALPKGKQKPKLVALT